MDPQALSKMMRMIKPFRFEIEDVQSTYKLNQNKSDSARLSAAKEIARNGVGSEVASLADLMQFIQAKEST